MCNTIAKRVTRVETFQGRFPNNELYYFLLLLAVIYFSRVREKKRTVSVFASNLRWCPPKKKKIRTRPVFKEIPTNYILH